MDAIVLAGGTGRRLDGADKSTQVVGGVALLQRVVSAASGADTIVVVGPRRDCVGEVVWCVEDPPGGGPVAAIAAGLPRTDADVVLVLAADLPWIAGAVPQLVTAVEAADCAVLVDALGRRNPLAAAWHREALERALGSLETVAGARAHALLDSVVTVDVVDTGGWGEDCDTWNDLERARRRAAITHGSAS